ncbi:hypothetical protein QTN25_006563 [Entamoeba marina]
MSYCLHTKSPPTLSTSNNPYRYTTNTQFSQAPNIPPKLVIPPKPESIHFMGQPPTPPPKTPTPPPKTPTPPPKIPSPVIISESSSTPSPKLPKAPVSVDIVGLPQMSNLNVEIESIDSILKKSSAGLGGRNMTPIITPLDTQRSPGLRNADIYTHGLHKSSLNVNILELQGFSNDAKKTGLGVENNVMDGDDDDDNHESKNIDHSTEDSSSSSARTTNTTF